MSVDESNIIMIWLLNETDYEEDPVQMEITSFQNGVKIQSLNFV
jgi:hypothetical protein